MKNRNQTTQQLDSNVVLESEQTVQLTKSSRSIWVRQRKVLIIIGLIILIVAGLYFIYYRNSKNDQIKDGAGATSSSQIAIIVNKVGKLMLLPSGEQPTVSVLNDASKYADVPFFKNAANGDRLLVYAQAREAILYRPSINKIIAVAPLSVNSQTVTGQ